MAYNPVPEGTYEVSDDGGTTHARLFNITAFTVSGGDREETTTDTLDEGSIVSVGPPRPKDFSITANVNPGTKGYQIIRDGYIDSKKVQVRVTTNRQSILDNTDTSDELAIAVDGALTATSIDMQASSAFQVGRGIVISNVLYVIESITSATAGTVYRADGMAITAVTATDDWEITEFGVRYVQECEVLNAVNPDLSPGSPYAETFTLKGTGVIGKPTFVFA